MEYLESCESTQKILLDAVKFGTILPPHAIVSKTQTAGVGSRGNSWECEEGNLYFSFCVLKSQIPSDVPEVSLSIYFSYLMKIYLERLGSKVWLKWPNDLYLGDKKIGGVITNKVRDVYICGIGVNLAWAPSYSATLDIKIAPNDLAMGFLSVLEEKISWKQTFSKFLLEFQNSKELTAHIDGKVMSLSEASLCEDGSILINNKRVYSLR